MAKIRAAMPFEIGRSKHLPLAAKSGLCLVRLGLLADITEKHGPRESRKDSLPWEDARNGDITDETVEMLALIRAAMPFENGRSEQLPSAARRGLFFVFPAVQQEIIENVSRERTDKTPSCGRPLETGTSFKRLSRCRR